MANINFPNDPTVNDIFTVGGKSYKWDGVKWVAKTTVDKSDVGLGNVQNFSIADQAEAEAGSVNNKYMTPLRTAQAITQLSPAPTIATTEQAEIGEDDTVFMTPLKTAQAIAELAASEINELADIGDVEFENLEPGDKIVFNGNKFINEKPGIFAFLGVSSDSSLKINSAEGNTIWTRSSIAVDCVDSDIFGNHYIGSLDTVYKFDSNNNLVWVSNQLESQIFPGGTEQITSISVDCSGNVFASSIGAGPSTVYKLDKNGNLLWQKDGSEISNNNIISISNDLDGNLYVNGFGVANVGIVKLDTNGNFVYKINGNHFSMAVDKQGNVFGYLPNGVRRYDSSGNVLWINSDTNGNDEAGYNMLAVDDNFLYAVQNLQSMTFFGQFIYKINKTTGQTEASNFTEDFLLEADKSWFNVEVDRLGNVYVNNNVVLRKFDNSLNFVWEKNINGLFSQNRILSVK